MEKSQLYGNRGDRRWESRKKWFRRLRTDWNDHWKGWPPVYEWKDGQMCFVSPGDATQLCDCFDLSSKAAIRFKDTPKGCSCAGCGNPRKWHKGKSLEELTFAEKIANLYDREFWAKRKRREGFWKVRRQCRACGYLLGIREVPYGRSRWYQSRMYSDRCEDCRKKGR